MRFSRPTAAVSAKPLRASTLAKYEGKWQRFCEWCYRREIAPLRVTNSQLADFLLSLFQEKQCTPRSIAVYRTAITATIETKKGGEVFGQIHELACEGQALYSRKATSEETSSAMKPFLGSKGTSSSPV